jgi:putative redox protein
MARQLTCSATLVDHKGYLGQAQSGHQVLMDAAKDNFGDDRGPRPMEMLLLGLAGCSGMVLVMLLRKMRQEPTAHRVDVTGEYSETTPGKLARVHIRHMLGGEHLRAASVERALELTEKTCPVGISIGEAIPITLSYEIVG